MADYTIVNCASQGWVLPGRYWEPVDGNMGFAKAPIGTGPYRLTKVVQDGFYELEAFDGH